MPNGNGQLNVFEEIGVPGLKVYGGNIFEEFLPQLAGGKAAKVFGEMSQNDPTVAAVLFAIEMMIRRVPWYATAASDSDADMEARDFLESVMFDMSVTWEDTISEILSFLPYGWSYHEILYKRRLGPEQEDPTMRSKFNDGRIAWRKFPVRAQESLVRWEMDQGGISAMIQRTSTFEETPIPIQKALLFRTTTRRNNPEGRSILRGAYRPWHFKKRIEEVEAIGIERDLAGLPVLQPPEGVKIWDAQFSDHRRKAEAYVRGIRRDDVEGAVIPFGWDLKLLSTGGSRQIEPGKVIERLARAIAMVVLWDVIMLGHEKVGSFALADSKTNLAAIGLAAWLDMIQAVFNDFAVTRLFRYNAFPAITELPKIEHGDIEQPDIERLSNSLQRLVGIGLVTPTPELEDYLREAMSLPEKPEEELTEEDEDDTGDDPLDVDDEELSEVEALAGQMANARKRAGQISKSSVTRDDVYEAARRLGHDRSTARSMADKWKSKQGEPEKNGKVPEPVGV